MRMRHKAGEKLFVDYAGQTGARGQPSNRGDPPAQIFVAVPSAALWTGLGANSFVYAEAQWSQDLPNWIGGHVRAFSFFGGVPEIVVPDNAKIGVKHPSRYVPDINPTYHDLARHYGMVVIPARVRKPKDKSKSLH